MACAGALRCVGPKPKLPRPLHFLSEPAARHQSIPMLARANGQLNGKQLSDWHKFHHSLCILRPLHEPNEEDQVSLVSLVSGLSSPLRPHHTLTPHQVLEREMPNLHFNRLSGTISDALSGAKLGASPLLECNALSGSVPLAWLGQAEHHPRMGLDLAAGSGQCGEFSNVVEPHLALAARYTSRKCGTSTCPPT